MSQFEDRQKAFERKFAHDGEMQFRAEARRNKLLGLWAAEIIGRTGDEADAYAREVVAADFQEKGDEDVYRKLAGDFEAAGTPVAEADIRAKMQELLAVAKAQLVEEKD